MEIMKKEIVDGPLEQSNLKIEENQSEKKFELYPFQREAVDWLKDRKFALLALCMGLGKSICAIVASEELDVKSVLIVCPSSVRFNWEIELKKFARKNLEYRVIYKKEEITDFSICSFDFCIRHYDALVKRSYDLIIVDEHHYLKSHNAVRTKNILGAKGLVHRCKRYWALTGTPIPNHVGELWTTLFTFGRTKLKYTPFITQYCEYYQGDWGGLTITGSRQDTMDDIREMLRPIMFRRTKDEVMKELPPITFSDVLVQAPTLTIQDLERDSGFLTYLFPVDRKAELFAKITEEKKFIEALDRRESIHGEKGFRALEAMAQSVSTLRRYTGLLKTKAIIELVKEDFANKAYEKVVIFAVHQAVIECIREGLEEFYPVTVYGNTPPEKRRRHVHYFMNLPKYKVFIGNIQAAGTGINLTSAHHVIMAESSFVPSENAQAIARCHRGGQLSSVNVRFISLINSLDQRINQIIRRKTRDIKDAFDPEKLYSPKTQEEILTEVKLPKPQEIP